MIILYSPQRQSLNKFIIIEDSRKSIIGSALAFKSSVITGRNPWKSDDAIINYELDSEEELAEE